MKLVKFVVVLDGTDNWLDMDSSRKEALAVSARWPGTHVERWTYQERPDGTHDTPSKERI